MMEPLQKRLRLYNPAEHGNNIAYDSDNYADLYADEYSGLEDDQDVQEEEEEDAEQIDPDEQLEQTRAQLDLKLKSKFEAIFEKYGRDFTGIGDEIDLRTGEIVVDNGHLLQMQDERDDGTTRQSLLEAFTQGPSERFGSIELDDGEVDEVHDSHVKLDDMEEDDMILFQNSGPPSGRPKTPSPRRGMPQDSRLIEREEKQATNVSTTSLPSEREILAQFGQDLGPKIAKYVAQQRVQDDSTIEPAWRTPGLPLATPGKRPILKSILLQPDIDRSPSPKGATSVWAPKMPPGRPRRDGADTAAVFRGETIIRDRTWFSTGYVSTTVTKKRTERVSQSRSEHIISVPLDETLTTEESELQLSTWANLQGEESSHVYELSEASDVEPDSSGETLAKSYKPRGSWSNPSFRKEQRTDCNSGQQSSRHIDEEKISIKRKRKSRPSTYYTKADDEALLAWVDDILKQGILLWSNPHWHLLAEKHPRHSYLGWKDRYRRQFYNKEANPNIKDDGVKESLETEKDLLQSARQSVTDSQSGRDDCSLSNNSAHKISQDALIDSTISPNIGFQTNTINNYRANSIDLETLDPALRPPLVIENMKISQDCTGSQQHLPPSDSSAVDLQSDSCMNHTIPSNTTTFRASRSSGLQPKMSTNENGPSTLCQEPDLGDAVVSENGHEVTALGGNNASQAAKADVILSTDTGMPVVEAITTRESIPPQQVKQKILDTTYDFSDEEDEEDIMGTHRLSHLKSADDLTPKHSVQRQVIDLTGEDSIPVKTGLLNRRIPNHSFHKNNQSPISISSSSTSDSDESEEFNFFLERTPPSDESHLTLSNILGPDSFYNLHKNSSPLPKQSSPGKKGLAGIGEHSRVFSDNVTPALNGNQVMKRTTPSGIKRVKSLRKSSEDSLDGSLSETPGGTKKKCGENGFRCGKGFCFKCLEG